MNHIMIDLETLGTRNSSVFLSIAAVCFDINSGETGREFSAQISLDSALKAGLTVDAHTIEWWMSQQKETKDLMFKNTEDLNSVLIQFTRFMDECAFKRPGNPEPLKFWGNSARFDLGILENGYLVTGLLCPWNFRYERCYRTIYAEFKDLVDKAIINSEVHNPLADCHYQIKRLVSIWKRLSGRKFQDSQFLENYEQALILLDQVNILIESEINELYHTSALRKAQKLIDDFLQGDSGKIDFSKFKLKNNGQT